MPHPSIPLPPIGTKYHRLTIQSHGHMFYRGKKRRSLWVKCDCGTQFQVDFHNVIKGVTKSCGCLNRELSGQRVRERNRRKLQLA